MDERREPVVPPESPLPTAVWLAAAATLVAIPLAFSRSGYDMLRLPKELVYRGGAIVAGSLLLLTLIWNGRALLRTAVAFRRPLLVTAAVLAWTLITTLTSTNRMISWFSFGWVVASITLFLALLVAPRRDGIWTLSFLLVPALVNAAVICLQFVSRWEPYALPDGTDAALRVTGLIGNPNDVGTFFFFPSLAAICAAVACRGRTRYVMAATAVVCIAATVVSGTRTAMIALLAAVVVIGWRGLPRRMAVAAAFVALLSGAAVLVYFAADRRVFDGGGEASHLGARLESIFSGRLLPYLVATDIARDHPLLGAGPGTFGFHYVPYKFQAQRRYPRLAAPSSAHFLNFGEVHNDHLEVAAETGLVGTVLFVLSLVIVGRLSFTTPRDDERDEHRFARVFALPFAAGFAVLALAQFPLQIAVGSMAAIFCAATAIRWSGAQ